MIDLKSASKKDVEEALEKGERAEKAAQRFQRSKKEIAMATAGMGAELAGGLAGGALVGWMAANDHEEWMGLLAVGIGTASGMLRLQEPENPYYQVGFATSVGMASALASTYARDYFSNNNPAPVT